MRIMPGEASIVPKDNISVVSLTRLSPALKLHDLSNNMIGIIVLVVTVSGSGSPPVKPAARRTRHAIQMTGYAHSIVGRACAIIHVSCAQNLP
jgi:hypothetical protein